MFNSIGGISLFLPFFVSISLFSYLEVYREKQMKRSFSVGIKPRSYIMAAKYANHYTMPPQI